VGTWVGTEVSYINQGLAKFTGDTAPAFLLNADGNVINPMTAFLNSLGYRFYPILAIFLVFLVALTGRDFGPMRRSEQKSLSKLEPDPKTPETDDARAEEPQARWWLGFFPIAVLIAVTAGVLILTGYYAEGGREIMQQQTAWWRKASDIIGQSDAYLSIFYGAILSAFVAILLTIFARACPTRAAFDAGLEGMSRLLPAVVILVLAWSLSAVLQELKLGDAVVATLKGVDFPAQWLPFSVFVSAALISFATGTSYGTMGILCPMTVEIGARLMTGMEPTEATTLFYAAIGSVLAGSVFGDHCSPISDTTVLSSIASGCRHEEHVWTQIPYALVAAVAAMGLGDLMCSVYKQPWYFSLAMGGAFLVLWVLIVGRRPVASFELADA
jgi:Na+/H+ antiporter NhaC